MIKLIPKNKGFTLVEMLVAVFVFSIVMTIAVGAIFTLVSASKSSQATKSVLDNLNGALDNITNEIRYGSNYHCDISNNGLKETPASCPSNGSATSFSFLSKDGSQISYRLIAGSNGGNKIQTQTEPGGWLDLTSDSNVNIKDVEFYVEGASLSENNVQPQVIITITGEVKNANRVASSFNIETMVTQRNPVCKTFMDTGAGHLGICTNNS